ncbi:2-phosphosulfolactate phosphatase [Paenibacillus sp. N1-5-1-14]|uniref:2-phosphosulfolactate phosphatase n=1 Tax=Paenibacillus radicibacter TaxID=2972488 RepID=UPI0021597D6E|nr:2-phosphosulfolactate phosphatase [Paenibacillus radicibacter]MCR8642427.1 2-phosphosulfolactate phosphatase [Paenibacillus radicibacter]
MQIDIISSVNEARTEDFIRKTVIVIDVLRATSTIVTAFEHGCKEILPAETIGEAKSMYQEGDMLGGERFCRKIIGFQLGNSPFEYMTSTINDSRIVMTTTNGTKAVRRAQKAEHILIGSFLNARACAEMAAELQRDIAILCAGTNTQFALEDGLAAGCIADHLMQMKADAEINDFGRSMIAAFKHEASNLTEVMAQSVNGRKLARNGFGTDIAYCAKKDVSAIVPIWNGLCLHVSIPTARSKTIALS